MTYQSKLEEELTRQQSLNRKVDLLAKAVQEIFAQLGKSHDLQQVSFDTIGNLGRRVDNIATELGELRDRIENLPLHTGSGPVKVKSHMTAKAMGVALGCSKDSEKLAALKFFARTHAWQHGLEVKKGEEGQGHKAFEWFPIESAQFAMEQVKGRMK